MVKSPAARTSIFAMFAMGTLGVSSSAAAQNVFNQVTYSQPTLVGTTSLTNAPPAGPNMSVGPRVMPHPNLKAALRKAIRGTPPSRSLQIPNPHPNRVVNGGEALGFPGINTADSTNVNGGPPSGVNTPPDQGLCAGNGFVMEAVNSALSVYSTTGKLLVGPTSIYTFFGLPYINGVFISDPSCYYDTQTQRWFVTIANLGAFFGGRSYQQIAVSQTSDPRQAFTLYSIDTTDDGQDGTPSDPGCPCFGDQPRIGADAYGFYVSTDEFTVASTAFNGAQIYAMSKTLLEAGALPTVVHVISPPLAEGLAFSVHPATSPALSEEKSTVGGVEYFMSALDFLGTLDDRIAVWALTNTRSLVDPKPALTLTDVVIASEVYGCPNFPPFCPSSTNNVMVTQKAGPHPLGILLGNFPEETLEPDDDRMLQTVFANGLLWSALNTAVAGEGSSNHAGIAYFVVRPSISDGTLTARLVGQNYVSIRGGSIIYPAIGVTAEGTAVMAFSLSGPSHFPSAAFARVAPSRAGSVHIVAEGAAPQDDIFGYPLPYGGTGVARWGDYSVAVADGASIWLATEYIPGGIDSTFYLTDWGTFVYKVNQEDCESRSKDTVDECPDPL